MAAAAATATSWAEAGDWAAHRSTIARLYADEDRTLREVMEIMKRDYSFFATTKMYKTRIKRWGLAKHLSANSVTTVLQSYKGVPPAAGESATVLIRGKPVERSQIEQYLRRTTSLKFAAMHDPPGKGQGHHQQQPPAGGAFLDSLRHVAMPSPRQLKSPEIHSLPEEVILLISQLITGSRECGRWGAADDNSVSLSSDTLVQWEHQLSVGRPLFVAGKYKHAFKVLDSTFAMLGQLLTNYEPAFFIYLFTNAIDYHPFIGQRLISYAAEMSKTKLSPHHPLALIWDRFNRAGVEQMRKAAWAILSSYLDTLVHAFGKKQKHLPFVVYWLLNDAFQSGLVGETETSTRLHAVIEQCEAAGERTHTLQAKTILINTLRKAGRYPAAKALLDRVMEANYKDGKVYNDELEEQLLYQRYSIAAATGTVTETIDSGRDYLQFVNKYRGPGHADAVWAASVLQAYLEKHGIPTDGQKLEEYSEPDWEVFCRSLPAYPT